ncbi:hypothetical protein [Mycobacterium sp. 852002-51057_SCH5723018]|uniref:hypothetical protein n=1 Tax=Mycobacterium sp. 852002-51057_SCH5723018 TaxID=1834094 RepID=UPI0007FEBAE0|nr:hypothetical protein [Mycobacterium sp. 852002-51057_SCH5723018]OBG20581.1 hypothetical protein A5764_01490 [Mycobacterium sp. 852002-51057_SCH5723018]
MRKSKAKAQRATERRALGNLIAEGDHDTIQAVLRGETTASAALNRERERKRRERGTTDDR